MEDKASEEEKEDEVSKQFKDLEQVSQGLEESRLKRKKPPFDIPEIKVEYAPSSYCIFPIRQEDVIKDKIEESGLARVVDEFFRALMPNPRDRILYFPQTGKIEVKTKRTLSVNEMYALNREIKTQANYRCTKDSNQ